MRILYLTYDVSDATTLKRVRMLREGGAQVHVLGFSRTQALSEIAGCPVTNLGRTYNNRFAQRIIRIIQTLFVIGQYRTLFNEADILLARNLEMLAIAVRAQGLRPLPAPLVYESLDIHRLLLRKDAVGEALRRLEGWLCKRACLLITSSPAFLSEYFEKRSYVRLPHYLLENKVFDMQASPATASQTAEPPWHIGWFGAIRCRKSLDILCQVARENPGLVTVTIRGRVAHDQFEDFDGQVTATDGVRFLGPYRNPDDLAAIYGEVHFNWAIDMFEDGLNSNWLLPNRIYEGGLYGAVPLAANNVETSHWIERLGIGHSLGEPKATSLAEFLRGMNEASYRAMEKSVADLPSATWKFSHEDCATLVQTLSAQCEKPVILETVEETDLRQLSPVLVIIPCLNEATHIADIIKQLIAESAQLPMRIVVADGGSTDGTVEIVRTLADQHAQVIYLHNPKRIQSAAMNLAVATYGEGHEFLIRIDAHSRYPNDYCQKLVRDALRTKADSVTTSVYTVGKPGFQEAVAVAQNSKLGNGGSSHRMTMRDGRWVDHGHHALMRIAAYNAVGGYDESFTHNEDAELDARLRKAGYRIWLTATTMVDYFPRATPLALFKQYRNYGTGRIRNLLKHRERPKLRQMLPVAILPATMLLILTPVTWLAAVPFAAWALLCLGYGSLLAWHRQQATIALSGPAAMLMHAGWSLGFWKGLGTVVKGKFARLLMFFGCNFQKDV